MKILYLEAKMGVAGDMFGGALLSLLPQEEQQSFINDFNNIGIPKVRVSALKSTSMGISGTKLQVLIDGEEEHHHHDKDSDCDHHHGHHGHHHHEHHHSDLGEIEHIVSHLKVSENIKKDIINIYNIIADAESKAHGCPVSAVHFHEVGMMDAIADVAFTAMLIHKIAPDTIISGPIHVGSGTVRCAHGIMPVPAPATANILCGIPIYSKDIIGELCTPTGAALVKYFVDKFEDLPGITPIAIGYGMGSKEFSRPNCFRVILGESMDRDCDSPIVLECNIDDMTPEEAGFVLNLALESGALEAFFVPATMKKSRPGFIFTVITPPDIKDDIVSLLFKHTSTIGIREYTINRYVLNRETVTVNTSFGSIRKKISTGYDCKKEKWEFEDLAKIAKEKGLSIQELKDLIHTSASESD